MKLEDWPEHVRKYVPPGFDFAKYEKLSELTVKGWFVEVLARKVRDDFKRADMFFFGLVSDERNGWPFSFSNTDTQISTHFSGSDGKGIATVLSYKEVVEPLLNGDVFELLQEAKQDREFALWLQECERYYSCMDAFFKENPGASGYDWQKSIEGKYQDYFNNPIDWYGSYSEGRKDSQFRGKSPYRAVVVNLNASDELIRESFDEWLEKEREKKEVHAVKLNRPRKSNDKITENDLKRFADLRVLEYWDLKNWFKLTGNKEPPSGWWPDLVFPEKFSEDNPVSNDNFLKKVEVAKWLFEGDGFVFLQLGR